MIDTHAHVHDRSFDDDRDAMLARARERGVDTVVTVGCDVEDSRRACETAGRYGLAATIGVHPHEARTPRPIFRPRSTRCANDTARASSPSARRDWTIITTTAARRPARRFRHALAYASARGLPLVFHQREAHEDFVAALRAGYDARAQRAIVHCFTGTPDEAHVFAGEFGLVLGIGGVVTFKTATALRDAVKEVGLDAIVLETDCPYLAPIPHRGRRNEVAFVADTARVVAEVLGVSVETVVARTDANARRVLGLAVTA